MALDKDILFPGNKVYELGKVQFVSITDNCNEVNSRRFYQIEVYKDGFKVFQGDLTQVSNYVGRSKQTISDCLQGRQKQTNGFIIKRV